jgi:molecular chaperone GrpE (heat shock protein)
VEARLESLEQKLYQFLQPLDQRLQALDDIDQRLQTLDDIDQRLQTLDDIDQRLQTLDGIDQRLQTLDGIDQHLTSQTQQLAILHQGFDDLQHHYTSLVNTTSELQASYEGLKKQISRSGKEQFKANSLTESQMENLKQALDTLKTADERREKELLNLSEQNRHNQAKARLEVTRSLLPVIDSLDEAARSGEQLLAQIEQQPETTKVVPPQKERSFFARLFGREPEPSQPIPMSEEAIERMTSLRTAMAEWLHGLNFITRRLLDILEEEHIIPMEVVGTPFDPEYHIAMDTTEATAEQAAGTITAELRRGFLHNTDILRHAEVVVAREPEMAKIQAQTEEIET